MAQGSGLADRVGPAQGGGGGSRVRPKPLAWVLLAVVVIGLGLGVRACVGGGEGYTAEARRIAAASASLGEQVGALRGRLDTLEHAGLFEELAGWQRMAAAHLEEAKELAPPAQERVAHGYLLTTLRLRADALRRYEPALRNALSEMDPGVAAGQIAGVLRDLTLADRSYELFAADWPGDDPPPPSAWVGEGEAGLEAARAFVDELRARPALRAVYNLRVAGLEVAPAPAEQRGETDVLPATETIAVTVTAENTGNQSLPGAPVSAMLTSEAHPEPQTAEGGLDAMAAGESGSITLDGLRPADDGGTHLLRVTVGPVADEQDLEDNTVEYRFLIGGAEGP